MSTEDNSVQNRLGQQAALMLNCDLILNKLISIGGRDRKTVKYKNFTTIRDNSQKSQTNDCYEITNLLTKNEAFAALFHKMPQQVLSLLQPSIKLYKIFYSAAQLKQTAENGTRAIAGYDWRIPFDDMAMGYSGSQFSSEFINNSITDILGGYGRLNGVGIKSFSYSYKGTNPAEINTNIVANLELFIASPDDLIKEIPINNDDYRFINRGKINGLPNGLTFCYSDLVNQSSRFRTNKLSEEKDTNLIPNEHYYRIKAVVGYAMPPDSYFDKLNIFDTKENDSLRTKIKTAINTSKIILLLTPFSHNLDFSENGNISLKIEYHAMIDSVLSSNDVDVLRANNSVYQEYKQAKKSFDAASNAQSKKINEVKCKNLKPNDREKELKKVSEETKKTVDEALKNLRLANLKLYSSLTKKILNLDSEKHRDYTGVFVVQLHYSAVGVEERKWWWNATGEADRVDNADIERIKRIEETRQVNSIVLLSQQQKEAFAKKIIDNPVQEAQKDLENKKASDVLQQKSDDENKQLEEDKEKYVRVKFVFLGDVLDAALECLKQITPNVSIPRIILGNIDIEIPTRFTGTEDEETKTATQQTTINIADIPISLELLNSFLIDKLVRQGKSSYPALSFIKDVITELAINCVSPKYFGTSAKPNNSIRISTLPLTIPLMSDKKDILLNIDGSYFSSNPSYEQYMNIIDVSAFQAKKDEIKKQLSGDVEALLANDVVNYYFIYCSTKFTEENNTGNEEKDLQKRIFHFRMGIDGGIVKKISFSKVDAPFYREAIASQEGKDNVSLIKQIYDTKIDMFGNNIYRPGDIIFVEPYVSFSKQTRSVDYKKDGVKATEIITIDLQDKVGLGGYYMINEVTTTINENVFTTSLTANFKAHSYHPSEDKKRGCN